VFLWGLRRSWNEPVAPGAFAWTRFCLIWCAFVLVFFSVSGSKLPSYILPIFPAAALVLGAQLERMALRPLALLAAVIASTTCLLWLGSVLGWTQIIDVFADARTPRAIFSTLGRWVKLGFGVGAAGYLLAWASFRRASERGKTAGIAALSMATILMMQAIYSGSDAFRATRSAADLVTTLENAANPPYDRSAPFFQVRMYDQTLPFYLERTTTLVDYRDELGPGLDAEPGLGIAQEADWIALWKGLSQGYALMAPETFSELVAAGIPMRAIASDPRRVLVARN
jgi:hypothetical protein